MAGTYQEHARRMAGTCRIIQENAMQDDGNMKINGDPLAQYLAAAIRGERTWIGENMEGYIPASLADSIRLARKNISKKADNVLSGDDRDGIGKILEKTTRKLGLFSGKARQHLENFYQGGIGIEVAHQPKFLGGERFILNKLALGGILSSMDETAWPFFYLADYDKVHPELTKVHFPLVNGRAGFTASVDPEDERNHDQTGIRSLPLPGEEYLFALLQDIYSRIHFSINETTRDVFQAALLDDRLQDALRLVKQAYFQSSSFGEWFLRIHGTITNVVNDHGYLFIVSSDPDYRALLQPFYEHVLKSRERYVSIYKGLDAEFRQHGLEPPLREISDDFVPFFYECPEPSCFNQRIQLSAEEIGSRVILQGKCPRCGSIHELVTSRQHPDLSSHAGRLTPRVESRQYLVQKSIAPGIHVSGTGETRYYTMSMPLMASFDGEALLPVIHFYNKITRNTFITRFLEQKVIGAGVDGLLEKLKALMKQVGKFNKLVKKTVNDDNLETLREKVVGIGTMMGELAGEMESACHGFLERDGENDPLARNAVESYLGNLFGEISAERHGQEAVFSWIDACVNAGMDSILAEYEKAYKPWLPPGLSLFL